MKGRCIAVILAVLCLCGCKGKGGELSVDINVNSITVSPSDTTIYEGETVSLTAEIAPPGIKDVQLSWTSENPEVADVDKDGTVSGLSVGWTYVYASVDEVKGRCKVTVAQRPEPDTPDPDNPDPDNPDPDNPDPDNPDPENPNPDNPDPDNPNPDTPDPDNPNPDNPDPDNPDPENPDPEIPENPELSLGLEPMTENLLVDETRRVGILGDSISSFDGAMCNSSYACWYPGNDPNVGVNPDIAVDSKEKTWWWKLIYEYMGLAELDANSSWSGKRVIHEESGGIGAGFVDRAYDFIRPDIIIIHGGTNDTRLSTPIGEYDWDAPVGEGDLSAFRSAYVQLVKMLQSHYDGVQLILIIGDRLGADYENSIKEIASHFNLPCVDFVGDDIPKCSGSHPTAEGHATMAAKIYDSCKAYL